MAKVKESKQDIEIQNNEEVVEMKKDTTVESKEQVEQKNSSTDSNKPSYDELMNMVSILADKVKALENNSMSNNRNNDVSATDRILDILSNRKSDKEVTIVHNQELINGLSTHIELNGLTIDFHSIGEQRLLSWQQFEECVSKYRRFFNKEIILLSDEHEDLSSRYNIPCVNRGNLKALRHEDIVNLPKLSPRALEDYISSLSSADQDFVFSYWLGKCYDRTPEFYDRYKIEMLNSISKKRVFDNLLTFMNGDYKNNSN